MQDYSNSELIKLKSLYPYIDFYFFEEINSTNTFCKTLASKNFNSPTVVLSDTQTSGRGTKGRCWTSPKNKGLWFSILLKPDFHSKFLGIIPILAATAINEALLEFDIKINIKWPNDIFLNDKKLCGILTEGTLSKGEIDYLIVGIGINVNLDMSDFDSELQEKATSLKIAYGKCFNRFEILSTILKHFNDLYSNLTDDKVGYIIKKYKANSCVLNKKVSLHYNKTYEIVTPINIMNDGSLLVQCTNNKIKQVYSGEVSLRF